MSNYTKFPIGDWDPYAEALIDVPLLFLPQVWGRLIHLKPPPGDDEGECASVANAATKRSEERVKEILLQDSTWLAVIAAVTAVIPGFPKTLKEWEKNPTPKPQTLTMLRLALWELNPGLYFQKKLINRGRPDKTCETLLKPVIPTPGHPAYPAGHAAQAYTVALLLGTLFADRPGISKAMLGMAARVSENRVIAGIHFPSDCEAGRTLALKFVPLLLGNAAFQNLLAMAATECKPTPTPTPKPKPAPPKRTSRSKSST